jgi:hypothetical protein
MTTSNRLPATFRRLGALTLGAAATLCAQGMAQAETLYGLSNTNQLITFDSASPMNGTAVQITGLKRVNERLLGLDARPATGLLYTLSKDGNLYTLDAASGQASFVASLGAPLAGNNFGVDFNPVPDLGQVNPSLRVISNSGQNLAVNVNGSAAGTVVENGRINGVAPQPTIVSVAYANNDRNPATGTTLYGIDTKGDGLYTIVPATGAATFVGDLGVDSIQVSAFDISYTGAAFASLTGEDGYSSLYSINLTTGQAMSLGAFGIGGVVLQAPVVGLTAAPVPEPSSIALAVVGLLGMVGLRARRRQQA